MDSNEESRRDSALPPFRTLADIVLEKQGSVFNCEKEDEQDIWNELNLQISSPNPSHAYVWDKSEVGKEKVAEYSSPFFREKLQCQDNDYRTLLCHLACSIPEGCLSQPTTEVAVLRAATAYIKYLYLQLRANSDTDEDLGDSTTSSPVYTNLKDTKTDYFSIEGNVGASSNALNSPGSKPMFHAMSSLNLSDKNPSKDRKSNIQMKQNCCSTKNLDGQWNGGLTKKKPTKDSDDGDRDGEANDNENDENKYPNILKQFSQDYPALASLIIEQTKMEKAREIQKAEVDSTTLDSSSSSESNEPGERLKLPKKSKGPKRPKNGFIRFSVEQRRLLADDKHHLDNREVSRMLGAKWRRMTNEEKKPYEQEFKKDMQEIREQNPTWRYAPLKRLSHDQLEPMPSRLRPRDKLKRKFLPLVRGSGRRRLKRGTVKKQTCSSTCEPELSQSSWIQCNFCSKWRRITHSPGNYSVFEKIWFCSMNLDTRYNSCLANEEWNPRQAEMQGSTNNNSLTTPREFSSPTQYILYREPSW